MKNSLFIQNLNKVMLEKKVTQKQIADKLGLSKQSISNWFNQGSLPSDANLKKLCIFLEVKSDDLLYQKDTVMSENKIIVDKYAWEAKDREIEHLRQIIDLQKQNESLKNNPNVYHERQLAS